MAFRPRVYGGHSADVMKLGKGLCTTPETFSHCGPRCNPCGSSISHLQSATGTTVDFAVLFPENRGASPLAQMPPINMIDCRFSRFSMMTEVRGAFADELLSFSGFVLVPQLALRFSSWRPSNYATLAW